MHISQTIEISLNKETNNVKPKIRSQENKTILSCNKGSDTYALSPIEKLLTHISNKLGLSLAIYQK